MLQILSAAAVTVVLAVAVKLGTSQP